MGQHPISLSGMRKAATTLRDVVNQTPLLETAEVGSMFGECLLLIADIRTARMVVPV